MKRRAVAVALLVGVGLLGACGGGDTGSRSATSSTVAAGSSVRPVADAPGPPADCPSGPPQRLVPEVLRRMDHDPEAFTQGLLVHDGILWESTGRVGTSSVRATDPATGTVLRQAASPGGVFAEGLAVRRDGSLVQLTWKDGTALVWDPATMQPTGSFRYDGEGWGLTAVDDGTLLMSDGSDRITERDPSDFSAQQTWTVRREDGPADELNELEWDGSHLWANRWRTDEIVRIDRRCRRVDAVVDAAALVQEATGEATAEGRPVDVLNGIAAVPGTDRFLVTGKLWPTTFEVRFVPA